MSLLTNLVCYLKLDEAANTTRADSSGNGNNFTDNNSNVGQTAGIIGNAALFNGTASQYLSLASILVGPGAFSVSGWINLTNFNNSVNYIWSQANSSDLTVNQQLSVSAASLVIFRTGGGTNQATYSAGFSAGSWHHLAGTWNGSGTLKLYVDGVYRATSTGKLCSTAGMTQSVVGGQGGTAGNCAVDEVGLWTRVLTDGGVSLNQTAGGEIAQLYNSGAGLTYPFGLSAPELSAPYIGIGIRV